MFKILKKQSRLLLIICMFFLTGCPTGDDSGDDVTAPELLTASVEDSAKSDVVLTFDKNVTVSSTDGFEIEVDDVLVDINSVTDSGTSTITLTLAAAVDAENILEISYDGSDDVQDTSGNPLEAFSEMSITNNVQREGYDDTNLSGLTLSAGTLSPAFSAETTVYSISVPNQTEEITVTPVVADSIATVTVDGTAVNSGSASEEISLNEGANTITVIVTAESGSIKTYTINATRTLVSTNSDLASLVLSEGVLSPLFSAETTVYNTEVVNSVNSITVTPTVDDSTAVVSVDDVNTISGSASQSIALVVGNNIIDVVVTAEDNSEKTYRININRRAASTNSALSSLVVDVPDTDFSLFPPFNPSLTSYSDSSGVANSTTSATVTAVALDEYATVRVNGNLVNPVTNSVVVALDLGENIISILVTAESGAVRTYTVTFSRKGNPLLSNLVVSEGTLNQAFSSEVTFYSVVLPFTTLSIDVTPTVAGDSTIEMNDVAIASGATRSISLNPGYNRITMKVTDGPTDKYYSLTITRSHLDTSFDIGTGPNDEVTHVIVQADDKVVFCGLITSFNGASSYRCIRLNADGSLDNANFIRASWGPPALAASASGDLYVANSTGYSYYYATRKFNANGSADYSFSSNEFDYQTRAIAIQNDNKVVVGGDFTESVSGPVSRNRIARQNANGTLDTSFDPGTGANNSVRAIAIQTDGKIIIGGYFTSYNGVTQNRIARLNSDGSLDTSFNSGSGANGSIISIVLQGDGKILIGGGFSLYNGTSTNSLTRLNSDGSLDESFASNLSGITGGVCSIILDGNKIYAAGGFYNSDNHSRIARINEDGTLDTTFGTGAGPNHTVRSIGLQSTGNIIIGGDFSEYNGVSQPYLSRILGD